MATNDQHPLDEVAQEKPPFFKHWRGMYALLAIVLVLQVVIYYIITLIYN